MIVKAKQVLTGDFKGTVYIEQGGTVRIVNSPKFGKGSTLLRNVFKDETLRDVEVDQKDL